MDPHKILAKALERAHKVADHGIIKSSDLPRGDREKLIKSEFIREIIRGWYMFANLTKESGQSTTWYASFWDFLRVYLKDRLGKDYCLSAECSLDLWAESEKIPNQVIIMADKASTYTLKLPFNTSVLIYKDAKNSPNNTVELRGLQLMPMELALVRVSPSYYQASSLNVEVLLRVAAMSDICRELLQTGNVSAAARISEAYNKYGIDNNARQIVQVMESAGFNVKESEMLEGVPVYLKKGDLLNTPYVGRIRALWQQYKKEILKHSPKKSIVNSGFRKAYWRNLEEEYVNDAYNSLSIEGYKVTPALIEKISNGQWNPDHASDAKDMDALAAKGYRDAHEAVKKSIEKIFSEANGVEVIRDDLQGWYSGLFKALVRAGIMPLSGLAGYRNHAVFIKNSRHVPPRYEVVSELMDTYFDLLENESDAWVRVVLGHFMFVYIHPYMDGNGRLGRFIMNALLAVGGYDWAVIEVARRNEYMDALETASAQNDISPLNEFLLSEVFK